MNMNTQQSDLVKSPFDNVMRFLGGLPQGHEKALKQALYNALAIFFLFICVAAGWALLYVLEPFIKPLMWALLCGSVLHPFKYTLSTVSRNWIDSLSSTSTPLLLGIITTPIKIIDDAAERIGNKILNHLYHILSVVGISSSIITIYYLTPHLCVCFVWQMSIFGCNVISIVIERLNLYWVISTAVFYLGLVATCWTPQTATKYHIGALCMWSIITCYIAGFTGTFQIPVFFFLHILLLIGFFYEVCTVQSTLKESGAESSLVEAIKIVFREKDSAKSQVQLYGEKKKESSSEIDSDCIQHQHLQQETPKRVPEPMRGSGSGDLNLDQLNLENIPTTQKQKHITPLPLRQSYVPRSIHLPQQTQSWFSPRDNSHLLSPTSINSNKYFYVLGWACTALILWRYGWFMILAVPILVLIYVIKHLGHYFMVWQTINNNWRYLYESFQIWFVTRQNALTPVPITGLLKISLICRIKLLEVIKNSIDTAASIAVILGLIIFVVCTSVFLSVQVYAEGINLVQIAGSTINNTLVRNSQLFELLPEDWQGKVDAVMNNAYFYGREGITNVVQSWLKNVDEEKRIELQNQILDLWDRVYQAWISSNSFTQGPIVTSGAVFSSWENFMNGLHKTPELFNVGALVTFARENVETLLSVLDSIWLILKGNISLAFESFTALVAILFGGGTAVINFFVNLVVFFTALFYLLSSSGRLYKPVDLITIMSPNNGSRFAVALENAIASVFLASFKMAVFHGLWTWLLHNLFQANVVYIPTVLSAILGAVPFLGTYWATLPAVLDLWFNQERQLHAILMVIFEMIVTSLVDTTIYQEVKGSGHPYLTGLSVAGGIFCMGVEGAIVGPILLCGVFLAVNMSSTLMREASDSEQIQTEQIRRLNELSHYGHLRRQNTMM